MVIVAISEIDKTSKPKPKPKPKPKIGLTLFSPYEAEIFTEYSLQHGIFNGYLNLTNPRHISKIA